jgi:molybdate transport system permease protein
MPLVLPPAVLGFYFLMILGPLHLAFTFYGLVIASVVYSLPFALQPFLASFRSIHPEVLESSVMLGGSRFQTFLRVVLPLSLPGIISGGILAFVHVLGEFGVVLMIGGNIPGESRTLSISIYDEIQSLNFSSARRMSAVLLCICFITVMSANYFSKVNYLRYSREK